MRTAELLINLGTDAIAYALSVPDAPHAKDADPGSSPSFAGPPWRHLEDFDRQNRASWSSRAGGGDAIASIGSLFLDVVVPVALQRALAGSAPAAINVRVAGSNDARSRLVERLPWEVLPRALALRDVLVSRIQTGPQLQTGPAVQSAAPSTNQQTKLVLVAPRTYRGIATASAAEATALRRRFANKLDVSGAGGAQRDALSAGLLSSATKILHLSSVATRGEGEDTEILVSESSDGHPEWMTGGALSALVAPSASTILLSLLNCPGSGTTIAAPLCLATRAPAIGWLGHLEGDIAATFAIFLYDRLLAGATIDAAVRAFLRAIPPVRTGALPIIWLPVPDATGKPIRMVTSGLEAQRAPSSEIIEAELPPNLSPAVFRNSVTPITSLRVDRPARRGKAVRVRLQIECDTGLGKSVCTRQIESGDGMVPVDTSALRFPVLQELVRQKVERREVNFTIRLFGDEKILFEETRSVQWLGHAEWLDKPSWWTFLPAYVLPRSDAVQDICDHAEQILSEWSGSRVCLHGYDGPAPLTKSLTDRLASRKAESESGLDGALHKDLDERSWPVIVQMEAFFLALRRPPYEIAYAMPLTPIVVADAGGPAKGQVVRLPDEIVARRRATCHDLSLLLAGCAESAQLRPLLILQRSHTFMGIWLDTAAQRAYWANRRQKGGDDPWLIRELGDLIALVQQRAVLVVDAKAITEPQLSFYEACRHAMDLVAQDGFEVAVDVTVARVGGIRPL